MGSWRGLLPGFDAETRHRAALAHLPIGTVRDYKKLQYVTFLSPARETIVLAREWIDMSTVVENEAVTFVFTLVAESRDKFEIYRQALIQNGAKNIQGDII